MSESSRVYKTTEDHRKRSTEWNRANKPRKSKYDKKRYNDYARDYYLQRNYGITLTEYTTLLKQQNDVCAICYKKCSAKDNLAVDHCHKTNKVRALLCLKCNLGLGCFLDDADLVERAFTYLRNHA